MGQINSVINLEDHFSGPLRQIMQSMSATTAEVSKMQKAVGANVDMSSYRAMQREIDSVTEATRKLNSVQSQTVSESEKVAIALTAEAKALRKQAAEAQEEADAKALTAAAHKRTYEAYLEETKALKVLTAEQKKTEANYKAISEKFQKEADAAQIVADKLKINAEISEMAVKKTSKLTDSIEQAAKSVRNEADAFEELAKHMGTMAQPVGGATKAWVNATDSLNNFFMAVGGYKMMELVKTSFVETSKAAIEFESAVTGIFKTVNGTQEQLMGLSDAVKEMALQIPASTTEIAGVMESAGQLGIKTDNITDFTRVMIDLGEATNLSSDEAASSLAKFANVTGMSADKYRNLGSTIVDLGNNFATTEADIVNMSSYLASSASLAGFTETDILALSTAMSSLGINAEAGGSAMSQLITQMQTAVETGSDNLTQFASVANMSADEFKQAFSTNVVGALEAFIVGLNDVERNGASASVILGEMDLDGIRLANTIKALASGSDVLNSAVDMANNAWEENTALTTEAEKRYATLESKLKFTKNAANNLKIEVGNSLTPALGSLADTGTDILTWTADMAKAFPSVTAGVMGFGGTLGTVVGGLATALPTINAGVQAFKALELSTKALAIGGGVIGGVALLAGVGAGLYTAFSDAENQVEDYNGTLKQCSQEIENTRLAHEKAVSLYGEESDAAKDLQGQLDTLNAQYEKGGGHLGQLQQEIEETTKAFSEFSKQQSEAIGEIDSIGTSGLQAVAMLQALSDKANITNTDLDLMQKYADYLNDTFKCNIEVNYDTKELTGFNPENPQDIVQMINYKTEENKKDAALDYFSNPELSQNYIELSNQAKRAQTAYDEAFARYEKAMKYKNSLAWTYNGDEENYQEQAMKAYEDAQKAQQALDDVMNGTKDSKGFNTLQREIEEQGLLLDKTGETTRLWIEEMTKIPDTVSALPPTFEDFSKSLEECNSAINFNLSTETITAFAEAYEETYNSIRTSLDGMFSMFEKVPEEFEKVFSYDEAMEGLQSQLDYFSQYEEAIKKLSELKLDDSIISQLDPAQAIAFVEEFEKWDASTVEQKVKDLNSTFGNLSGVKDEATKKLTELDTELKTQLSEIEKGMKDQIEQMDASSGAKMAAIDTMNAYMEGLRTGGNQSIEEAQRIVNKIKSIFSGVSVNIPGATAKLNAEVGGIIGGYATGTLNAAPGLALVGEKGPELINFGGGEVVYTADETQRILDQQRSISQIYIPQNVQEAVEYGNRLTASELPMPDTERSVTHESTKRVVLEIAGNGSFEVKGGVSREEVYEMLAKGLKPAILDLIDTEIYEEGEGSYDT